MPKSKLPQRWHNFVKSIKFIDFVKVLVAALASGGGMRLSFATLHRSAVELKAFIVTYPSHLLIYIEEPRHGVVGRSSITTGHDCGFDDFFVMLAAFTSQQRIIENWSNRESELDFDPVAGESGATGDVRCD